MLKRSHFRRGRLGVRPRGPRLSREARGKPKQLPIPEMKFNDVKEIAPGVFFRYSSISANDPKIPFGGSNHTWIVFKDYVVVIDANFPKEAADVIFTGEDGALAVERRRGRSHRLRPRRSPARPLYLATADALAEVVEAVAGRVPVLVDGGIERRADVAIALALGADGVLIGRAALWGLAVGGEAGALRVLELLRAELELTIALCGCRRPPRARCILLVKVRACWGKREGSLRSGRAPALPRLLAHPCAKRLRFASVHTSGSTPKGTLPFTRFSQEHLKLDWDWLAELIRVLKWWEKEAQVDAFENQSPLLGFSLSRNN